MTKRSQRRLSRHEREQAGCIWSFISILDFRRGRSARKLIADRRRASRQAVGAGNSSTKIIIPSPTGTCQNADGEEIEVAVADVTKSSVKELMEEEMFTEQGLKSETNESEICLKQIDSEHGQSVKKNQKRIGRTHKKSIDMDITKLEPLVSNKVPEQKPSDNLDWEIMEELSQIYQKFSSFMKLDSHDDLDMPSGRNLLVEEKLFKAIKVFRDQRLSSGKHFGEEVKTHCSKEFMDALQTLSSNKGLFLKLLQDPNSVLMKHMQNLDDTQLEKDQKPGSFTVSVLSKEKLNNSNPDDLLDHKHRKFFHRKSKSLGSYPTGGNKNCQSSSKIVILKPGPAGSESPRADISISSNSLLSPYAVKNKVQNERNTSQFSFTEIKRKLRHAMGKEKPGIAPDGLVLKFPSKFQNGNDNDKGASGEIVGWSSPNRNHFYTERFTKSPTGLKSGEHVGKSKVNGAEMEMEMENETLNYPRKGVSNIYIEAKKHLSEMLNIEDENVDSGSHRLTKSLGRILSFAEYSDSPSCSPRKYGGDIFITSQMRLSPRGMASNMNGLMKESHDNHPSSSGPNLESQLPIAGDNANEKVQSHNREINIPSKEDRGYSAETQSFNDDVIIPEARNSSSRLVEIEETTRSRTQEGEKHITISRDLASDLVTRDVQDSDIEEMTVEESPSQCFKAAPSGDDQTLSSPSVSPRHSPISRKAEDRGFEIDKMERPSPISVFEPLFTEDVISPASTTSQSDDKEIQPRQIHFEEQYSAIDQGICTRISIEGEESAFEYVEAVLLGSGLNWDDFILRWLSLNEILDPSLFDEVELFSSRSRHDQKLLFDCTNQVLKDICETYFGCFDEILFSKQYTHPIPTGMNLIDEVWENVELHLFQHPSPESLDQLIKRGMAKHEKWMYLRSDIEHIGIELGETIFMELVEDTVLSFANDTSEYEFTVLPDESEEIEDIDL